MFFKYFKRAREKSYWSVAIGSFAWFVVNFIGRYDKVFFNMMGYT